MHSYFVWFVYVLIVVNSDRHMRYLGSSPQWTFQIFAALTKAIARLSYNACVDRSSSAARNCSDHAPLRLNYAR